MHEFMVYIFYFQIFFQTIFHYHVEEMQN